MHSIWRDWKSVAFYEILLTNRGIDSSVHSKKLNVEICQKYLVFVNRKNIVFRYDNVGPHTSFRILQEFWREIWASPPYSPDLALSDIHLLLSLQNSLNGQTLKSEEDAKIHQEEVCQ